MLIVHHLNNSRSQRILWLLEELELPYQVERYERDRKTMLAPPSLRNVHPLGKSPVLVDEGACLTIAETGAIIEYIVDKAGGRLRPSAGNTLLLYRYFLHYAEGSVMPPLLLKLVLGRIPIMGKLAQKRIQPMIEIHLDFIESELSQRPWFAGESFSAADIMMSFPLEAARSRAGLDESRPATIGWLKNIHHRPAYQTALAQGGTYAYA